jgi:protease I
MQEKSLAGLRVAVIVADDFEQVEMTGPRHALDDAGAKTMLISTHGGQVHGFHHDTKGDAFNVEATLDQVSPDDFDAVLIPGGALNADEIRVNPLAQEFVRRIDSTNRPIAVICHGPWLLVSAGLVCGRQLTSYHTIQDDIRNAGGHWLNFEMVRDRNWVSSRQPSDIPAFNQGMLTLFAEARKQQKRAA